VWETSQQGWGLIALPMVAKLCGVGHVACPGLPVSAGGCAGEREMLSMRGCRCFCRKARVQQPLRK